MWQYDGQQRPEFAEAPGPDQESVWDYPRPPAIIACAQRVEIKSGATTVAESDAAVRVLETASPPTVYIPPNDIRFDTLAKAPGNSFCEWKGAAQYWCLATGDNAMPVGWSYPDPLPAFATIRDWLCFYPGRIECLLDGERVQPQEGGFYGGWVTSQIVGPWKGGPNTGHW